MDLLHEITRFCVEHGLSPSRFGKLAVNDPALTLKLERGRTLSVELDGRVRLWMAEQAAAASLGEAPDHATA